MKTKIQFIICFVIGALILNSCGISKEVRSASADLIKTQESSLSSQIRFHESVIAALTLFLDAELERSLATYNDTKSKHNEGLIEVLGEIYSNTTLSEAEKKMEEEKARQKISDRIEKAKFNRDSRNDLIQQSKEKLIEASQHLISAEKAKLKTLISLDNYLQAKRPSEKLLDMVNIDINNYTQYVDDANNAIVQAEGIIEQLKDLK